MDCNCLNKSKDHSFCAEFYERKLSSEKIFAEKNAIEEIADQYLRKYMASRQVIYNLLLELTEDGCDMSHEELIKETDKLIKSQLELLHGLNAKDVSKMDL